MPPPPPSPYLPRYVNPPRERDCAMSTKASDSTVSLPKSSISAQAHAKRHVSAALKHLANDTERSQALSRMDDHGKLFADPKFEVALANLKAFAEEDHLRLNARRRPAALVRPRTRPRLKISTSAPPAPLDDGLGAPIGLPRHRTVGALSSIADGRERAASLSRERWDIVPKGPLTPLSPTPVGNAFAEGGFWEHSTPSAPATPVTAVPRSPTSPNVPTDEEAREVYEELILGIDSLARQICERRISALRSSSNSSKPSRHKPIPNAKDELTAAQMVLSHLNLQSVILAPPADIPTKLTSLAGEEAQTMKDYTLLPSEVEDMDTWLQVEPTTLEHSTILDAQRDFTRMNRQRRKSSLLQLSEHAMKMAWATRILEDKEHAVEVMNFEDDEDRGYDYNNFLRSIKSEASFGEDGSTLISESLYSDNVSKRSRAMTGESAAWPRDESETMFRMSDSPKKLVNRARRSMEALIENRKSWDRHLSGNWSGGRGGSLITTNIEEDKEGEKDAEVPTMPSNVVDKASRRKGASHTDLNRWAMELRNLRESVIETDEEDETQQPTNPALRTWSSSSEVEMTEETSGEAKNEEVSRSSFQGRSGKANNEEVSRLSFQGSSDPTPFPGPSAIPRTPPRRKRHAPSASLGGSAIAMIPLPPRESSPIIPLTQRPLTTPPRRRGPVSSTSREASETSFIPLPPRSSDSSRSSAGLARVLSTPTRKPRHIPTTESHEPETSAIVLPPRLSNPVTSFSGLSRFSRMSQRSHPRTPSPKVREVVSTNRDSTHDVVNSHRRSRSEVSARDGAPKVDEEQWVSELERMESRERVRQLEECEIRGCVKDGNDDV